MCYLVCTFINKKYCNGTFNLHFDNMVHYFIARELGNCPGAPFYTNKAIPAATEVHTLVRIYSNILKSEEGV